MQKEPRQNQNPLPETGLLRLKQIIGDPRAEPPLPPIIPVSRSTWYQGIKDGRFPRPINLGGRSSFWRVEDIRALLEGRYEAA